MIAYRTVPPPKTERVGLEALRRGEIDVVALASPSATRNLVAMLGAEVDCLHSVRLACIGPTTAGAVDELGLAPAIVAEPHTLDGLAAAITDLYREETQ